LDSLAGRGHTVLRQVSVDGIEQISTGDVLDAKFRPRPVSSAAKARPAAAGAGKADRAAIPLGQQVPDLVQNVVQQGHVTMLRRVPAKAGAKAHEDVEHAVAERTVYDGDQDRMTLTGAVQLMDAGSVLWANQATIDHKTGDAHAAGAVKVDYVQDPSAQAGGSRTPAPGSGTAEPTHILADRADLEHATDVATFYGKPARLWQGTDQVQAPVIEMARAQKRLIDRVVSRATAGAGAYGAGERWDGSGRRPGKGRDPGSRMCEHWGKRWGRQGGRAGHAECGAHCQRRPGLFGDIEPGRFHRRLPRGYCRWNHPGERGDGLPAAGRRRSFR
jgi:lipopolysaccharide export system protein LptA